MPSKKNPQQKQISQEPIEDLAENLQDLGLNDSITIPASTIKQNQLARVIKNQENLTSHNSISVAATFNLEQAKNITRQKVDRIAKECRQLNRKFRDREFDLTDKEAALYNAKTTDYGNLKVARIPRIMSSPRFYADGVHPGDIVQGLVGDCWFLSAISTCANIPGLLETICVARDEEVGVYGFIFFKDGDWVSTVVDDQLFVNDQNKLAFAQCLDPNETWLPLIEKAFAKIHGDYESITGGEAGEGLEDLTGGVYTIFHSEDIMNPNQFWHEELAAVNKSVLFGLGRSVDPTLEPMGIVEGHAYSILQVIEVDGQKLVKVRNPHGQNEWEGAWSDKSEEWTAEYMAKLDHKFGNDGAFWMSYDDLLKHFHRLYKCRIFDNSWNVLSGWIKYNVEPQSDGKFILTLPEASNVVILLQQPDDRYARGTQKFECELRFRVYKPGEKTYLTRSFLTPQNYRSTNHEVDLEGGVYEIVPRIQSIWLANVTASADTEAAQVKRRRIDSLPTGRDQNDDEDDDDENHEDINFRQNGGWQLTLGLRVYSRCKTATLEIHQGPYPLNKKVDPAGGTEQDADPEA
ncbi:hypothetical protein G9A89_001559 [Geosiphon pyriformis]|nr:hypothetical protein G9A89_001559 [Geosiphon pyriformis]